MSSAFPERPFDFSRDDARRLLLESEPEELFRAVEPLPSWNARALQVADAALTLWASSAHARHRDREGLVELHELIERLQVIHPADEQPPELAVSAYYHRWDGIAALLETRIRGFDRHDPAEVEQRAHMPELQKVLQGAVGPVATKVLKDLLGLSAPRLSQLLALAEVAGLIERRKEGREQWVTPAGPWGRESRRETDRAGGSSSVQSGREKFVIQSANPPLKAA